MSQSNYPIFGFISYSRKDKRIANWLHAELEKYVYPMELVEAHMRPPHKKYTSPIFLDTKDLQMEERPFSEEIKESIRRSKYLLLICSKNSVQSPYVDLEIRYFAETHNNNFSLVVPLFIDEVSDDSIPPAIRDTSVVTRHFPIFNTLLGEKSDGNMYCFLQVVSYILGVDFHSLYNRYEVKERQKRKKIARIYKAMLLASLLAVVSLLYNIYSLRQNLEQEKKMLEQEKELLSFEKDIFPRAVVYGYTENFLMPVIKHFKDERKKSIIHILLPSSEKDVLDHQNRYLTLCNEMEIDSLKQITLPTTMRRGSRIMVMMKNGHVIPDHYIDLATTTSSFVKVAEYKRGHKEYKYIETSQLIAEYSNSFMRQTNEMLEGDSVYVRFYLSSHEIIDSLSMRLHLCRY